MFSIRENITRFYIKLFIIALFSLIFIAIGISAAVFFNSVRPPEIPLSPVPPTNPIIVENNEQREETEENENYYQNSNLEENDSHSPIISELFAPERFTNEDRKDLFFTFLIIGLNEGTNANTIMVASYDGINREANLISIPRDSLMNVNRNVRKLSSSYMAGSLGGRGTAGGVEQMQREIMTIIGFIPDFYVIIDYDAFFFFFYAIGGIEIYVPFHMRYDDPLQNLHIDIQAGMQHMDSKTALQFARFRTSNHGFRSITDYERIANQQIIVNTIISDLLRPASIIRIPEFVNIFNESVHTNLTIGNMLWFASQLNHIGGTEALTTHTMPTIGTSGAPMWYELLDATSIVQLVNQTINPFNGNIELSDLDIIIN